MLLSPLKKLTLFGTCVKIVGLGVSYTVSNYRRGCRQSSRRCRQSTRICRQSSKGCCKSSKRGYHSRNYYSGIITQSTWQSNMSHESHFRLSWVIRACNYSQSLHRNFMNILVKNHHFSIFKVPYVSGQTPETCQSLWILTFLLITWKQNLLKISKITYWKFTD